MRWRREEEQETKTLSAIQKKGLIFVYSENYIYNIHSFYLRTYNAFLSSYVSPTAELQLLHKNPKFPARRPRRPRRSPAGTSRSETARANGKRQDSRKRRTLSPQAIDAAATSTSKKKARAEAASCTGASLPPHSRTRIPSATA